MKVFLTRALVFAFPCVAIAQIASLQIKVLEGEGAAHSAGAHISAPLTVQVTDDMGQPVAGAAVSFQLPLEGPSGLFSNGLRTDLAMTDAAGRASIQSIQLNRNGGQFRIRITAVKELTRDLGKGLHAVVQARAAINSFQYIDDNRPTPVAPATLAEPTAMAMPATSSAERSADITPTPAKMAPRSSKKWIVLAAIAAAAAGAAVALVVSRSTSSKSSSGASSTATIGTPTITIGNP
jgi:hypothetical protein